MTNIEIAQQIADYHNILSEVYVRGEDAIRMGDVLRSMRQFAASLTQKQQQPEEASDEKEA